VGRCVVRNHQGVWRVRRPFVGEFGASSFAAGDADLAIFQWWLKSLSDPEIDRTTLGDRYRPTSKCLVKTRRQ